MSSFRMALPVVRVRRRLRAAPNQFLENAELVIHSTKVATNTLVERKSANVALITTDGCLFLARGIINLI